MSYRNFSSFIVFNNKIWAFGDGKIASYDGTSWTFKTTDKDIDKERAIVFDNKLWLLGQGRIFYSNDGWNLNEYVKKQNQQIYYSPIVYDNKIWFIGGFYLEVDSTKRPYNKITSFDGKGNFIEEGEMPAFIFNYGIASFAGGLIIMGGETTINLKAKLTPFKGLWYSPNGSDWSVISDDLTTKESADVPTREIYKIVKWKPKKGIYGGKESLWISNNQKIYKVDFQP